MKRIVGLLIVFILSTGVYSVVAQSEQNGQQSNDQNALRQIVEKKAYGDNWFISLGVNANLLTAEQDGDISMWRRIKPGGSFTIGKWFTPDFGARIQVTGGALRGFNYVMNRGGYYVWANTSHQQVPMGCVDANGNIGMVWDFCDQPPFPTGDNPVRYHLVMGRDGNWGFWQDFKYASATIDLMGNLTNLFRGYDTEHNRIDIIPLVGLGWIHAFSNNLTTPRYDHFVAKIGVRVNFNINDKLAIYLEPQGNATTKEFDGYAGDNFGDGIVNLSLGVQYTFNKQFTSLYQVAKLTADEVDRLNKKINDNRYLIENHQDILERQQNLLDRLQKCCDDNKKQVITQVVEPTACLPDYVRFGLDSYKIDQTEVRKIAEIADYLKNNPNLKVLIVGYADKKTGNPRYNLNLSQKRVDAVAAELKRLGVNVNGIISEWKGDKEQPFPQNEWNRVVVMVERK